MIPVATRVIAVEACSFVRRISSITWPPFAPPVSDVKLKLVCSSMLDSDADAGARWNEDEQSTSIPRVQNVRILVSSFFVSFLVISVSSSSVSSLALSLLVYFIAQSLTSLKSLTLNSCSTACFFNGRLLGQCLVRRLESNTQLWGLLVF